MIKYYSFALILISIWFYSCNSSEEKNDYALLSMKDSWLRHPVLGDPSFDNFKRYDRNPLQRGSPPFLWPVNGFYFEDPVSGNEYVFAAQYLEGYAIGSSEKALNISKGCTVFCSKDQGKTWDKGKPVFKDEKVILEGEDEPILFAPDVSVVYDNGKYYMGFDYCTSAFEWAKNKTKHSGLAVAVSDSPEGPYHIYKNPVVPNSLFSERPLFGKYNRAYAGTLLKGENQWVMLFMLDSGPNYSWAQVAVSAESIEGPWSEPVFIRGCESMDYYPSLLEYFPAFQYQDTVYAPSTSVALNRNFQSIFRVPIGEIMKPDKWELWREGSIWHSENSENEFNGIWGQTLSGFISKKEIFKVMFPSRDPENRGTINLASTSWNILYRDTGFIFTGQKGSSYSEIPDFYERPEIDAIFSYHGTIAFVLNNQAPLGPNAPQADATLHPLMFSANYRMQLADDNHWFLLHASPKGVTDTISGGSFHKKEITSLKIEQRGSGSLIYLNDKNVWQGELKNSAPGRVGLLAMAHSGIDMKSFIISGKKRPGYSPWLYTEGLLNAGFGILDWDEVKDNPFFSYGIGAISKTDNARAKWSFTGTGFDILSPKMPELGKAKIILNGSIIAVIDLSSESPEKSKIVYNLRNLPQKKNAVVIIGKTGRIAIDCLRVYH